MQLTITLTSTKYQINKDIMVNSEQKICETLQILKEAGQINIAVGDEDKLRSMRTGMFVSKEFTYEEAGIFYGDILLFGKLNAAVSIRLKRVFQST